MVDHLRLVDALIETVPDALYAITPEGRLLHWGWGAENLYAYTNEQAIGRFLHETIVPPERWLDARMAIHEALSTGSFIGETPRRRRDGTRFDAATVMRGFGEGGERFVAVSERDITDEKRLQAEAFEKVWSLTDVQNFLNSVLEGSEDHSIIAMDLEGRIEAWNRGAHLDFGHEPHEAIGQHGPALLHAPADFATGVALDALRRAYEHGRAEGEFVCRRKDGTTFPAKISISLRRNAYNEALGYVLIARDLTEEKKVEEARRVAMEQSIEIQRLKDEAAFKSTFINTAAHELGTPLTPIRSQLFQLRNAGADNLTEAQRKGLALIERNVDRLTALLKDVLDVARMQSGGLPLRPVPFDLASVVSETAGSYGAEASARRIALEAQVRDPIRVDADPQRVTQVVHNLVANALKFTPEGGRVRVVLDRVGDHALVEVTDTGVGLTAEQIARLFRPFSQVHDTMERTNAGAGLGLYVARSIVEAHGGTIECESPGPGQGSTFRVRLPLDDAQPTH